MSKDNVAIAMAAMATVTIGETDFDFKYETESFNQYLNEQMPNDKINPAFNFLMRTVVDEQKEQLKQTLLNGQTVNGVVALQVAGVLAQQYSGGVNISLKKPKS